MIIDADGARWTASDDGNVYGTAILAAGRELPPRTDENGEPIIYTIVDFSGDMTTTFEEARIHATFENYPFRSELDFVAENIVISG